MVSERALREIYLKGFEIAVKKAAPLAVMTSYNLLNGTHTSERKDLTEVLRKEWGFNGIVMTDWVIGGAFNRNAAYPAPEAWKVAAAGGDLFMPGSKADRDNVLKALEEGKLSWEVIETNASRVLAMIRKLNG
jgi:beta-glucosidase